MSRLIDPSICPDCRAGLSSTGTCTGCGLQLTGPVASQLWQTMQVADALVERIRRSPGSAATGVAAPGSRTAGLPSADRAPAARRPARRLDAASVPVVLFGVGALCLLVAAIVFVAVAWSSLGLGARTTILLAVTAAFGALATRLTVRGLRGAAETIWLVVGALVTIDLVAGYAAGLVGFDHLAGRHAVAVLGASLLGLGLGVGSWARRTELPGLIAPTVLSTAGSLLAVSSEGWAAPSTSVGATFSVLSLAALATYAHHLGLRPTAYAVTALAVPSWVILVASGVDRASTVGASAWWTGLACWPLITAAVLAGVAAAGPRVAEGLRTVAATASELAIVLLVVAPGGGIDTEIVLLACLAVALAGASLLVPRPWAVPAAVFAGLGGAVAAGYLLLRPAAVALALPSTGPARSADLRLHLETPTGGASAWTAVVLAAAVVFVALALTGWIGDPAVRQTAERTWAVGAPTTAALGIAAAFLETGPTLLTAVLAWTAVLVLVTALAVSISGAPAPGVLAATGYLGVVGLRLAVPSHLLVALLATGLAIGLTLAYRRTGADPITRAITGASALVTAGFAATHYPYLLGGAGDAAGLTLAVLAATGGVLAARIARGHDRPVLEVTALALGLGAVAFPVEDAISTLVLTITGSAVALVSVLHRDREQMAWLGTTILGAAALVRLAHDLSLPELATAPAAVLLLAAGTHRMLVDKGASSLRVLGSGLTLALLPTLLLTIDEPVSARGAVLGAGATVLLAAGIAQRWAAPFLAGAAALVVLTVRQLGPVAEALPRWISLGTVGVLLLLVAITWESRRRQLETAERYLAALR